MFKQSSKFFFSSFIIICILLPMLTSISQVKVSTHKEKSSMYILLPELAPILPLPGKYSGLVATNKYGIRHIHGIAISPGEDNTKDVFQSSAKIIPKSLSDIVISKSEAGNLILETYDDVPTYLNLSTLDNNLDFESALKNGRVIRLSKGTYKLTIADTTTNQVIETIYYECGNNSTITWNKEKRRPLWRGFKIIIKSEKE